MIENPSVEVLAPAIIAALLELIPPLKGWWDKFNPRQKQFIMVLLMFLLTLLSVGYSCYRTNVCPEDFPDYAVNTAVTFIVMLVLNQGTYAGINRLIKQPEPNEEQ